MLRHTNRKRIQIHQHRQRRNNQIINKYNKNSKNNVNNKYCNEYNNENTNGTSNGTSNGPSSVIIITHYSLLITH